MSEPNNFNGPPRRDEGGLHAPPGLSPVRKVWWWFHFAVLVKLARLRFIAVLAAVGGVIAYWDTLQAYYEKATRPLAGAETAAGSDTEYRCPMHPNVVRDHPDKCPPCGMPLSRRKKGRQVEQEALPPGILSRVNLSPYKVAVAGIRTAEVGYRALTRDVSTVGYVEFDERKLAQISARPTGKSRIDKLYVNVTGQMVTKGEPLALLYSPELIVTVQNLLDAREGGNRGLERFARDRLRLWGIDGEQIDEVLRTRKPITHVTVRSPIGGHVIKKYRVEGEYVEEGKPLFDVADLSTVWIAAQVYEDEVGFLQGGLGLAVTAATRAFPNRTFEGKLAFIHPHLDASTRTLMVRFDMDNPDHDLRPGMYATVKLRVPATRVNPLPSSASDEQKQALKKREVLAIPEQAVIDTGSRKIVYRETEPDVFEGVEVELGSRCGNFYPVVYGLKRGDRIATAGSFLIDAETRLSGSAASTYFGASGGPQGDHRSAVLPARPSMERDEDRAAAVLAKLAPAERAPAEAQKYCPVLGNRLGTMGVPAAVTLEGQKVFLCCKSCVTDARADVKGVLAKVADLKARGKGSPPPAPPPADAKEARIRTSLAKLSAEDRRLAERQRFCAVQTQNRLGSMGVPVAVTIRGQKVFLCCSGCKDDALANPGQTLAEAEKLKKAGPGR